jgi:hypothetical protein
MEGVVIKLTPDLRIAKMHIAQCSLDTRIRKKEKLHIIVTNCNLA